VLKLAMNFIKEHQPGRIHLLGDIVDMYNVSRFDKDPTRGKNLQEELDITRTWLTELRAIAPKSQIIFSEGNHEYRLKKYLMSEAKALAGLRCLSLDTLLDFDKLKIRWQAHDRPYKVGQLLFTHGTYVSKWSGYSAKRHFEKYGCCTIHGHTHRLGSFYHTVIGDTYGAWENGCLCEMNPDYMTVPNWQQGWSVAWIEKNGSFHIEQVPVIHGQYNYHGKVYGKKRVVTTIVEEL
jgi:UDP-2,3-diacylglucosamine pyrophosphatase LpxH